jgi:hypothetical protein
MEYAFLAFSAFCLLTALGYALQLRRAGAPALEDKAPAAAEADPR